MLPFGLSQSSARCSRRPSSFTPSARSFRRTTTISWMKKWPDAKKSNTGIRYVVEKPGRGPYSPGDLVMVNYTGALLNGKVFDQNHWTGSIPSPSGSTAAR
jgi:FKBP-type peptidyl-prolyl cis-trans isomerase